MRERAWHKDDESRVGNLALEHQSPKKDGFWQVLFQDISLASKFQLQTSFAHILTKLIFPSKMYPHNGHVLAGPLFSADFYFFAKRKPKTSSFASLSFQCLGRHATFHDVIFHLIFAEIGGDATTTENQNFRKRKENESSEKMKALHRKPSTLSAKSAPDKHNH